MIHGIKIKKTAALLLAAAFALTSAGCGPEKQDVQVAPDSAPEVVQKEAEVTEAAPAVTEPAEEKTSDEEDDLIPPGETYYKVSDELTLKRKVISTMYVISQGDLLTGCEATGLTTALNWYGYDVDKFTLADSYMPQAELRWEDSDSDFWDGRDCDEADYWGGFTVGMDFRTTFIGYPYREEGSYGCYAPCLVRTANNYFRDVGSSFRGRDISGMELRDLFRYVQAGIPVVLIMTPYLEEPKPGDSWYAEDTDEMVHWQKGHHCMVLIGYDINDNYVYTADPSDGCLMIYDLATFEWIYELKGRSAMYIDTGAVKLPERMFRVGDYVRFAGRTYRDCDGTEEQDYTYLSEGKFKVDEINPDRTKPYRVHLEDLGWVGEEVLRENIPYYGNGDSNTAAFENGMSYAVRNVHSTNYLTSEGRSIVHLPFEKTGMPEYRIQFNGDEENSFKIYVNDSECISASPVKDSRLQITSADEASDWVLYRAMENDNKYVIVLREDHSMAVTADDYDDSEDQTRVFMTKYTGAPEQMWYFEK